MWRRVRNQAGQEAEQRPLDVPFVGKGQRGCSQGWRLQYETSNTFGITGAIAALLRFATFGTLPCPAIPRAACGAPASGPQAGHRPPRSAITLSPAPAATSCSAASGEFGDHRHPRAARPTRRGHHRRRRDRRPPRTRRRPRPPPPASCPRSPVATLLGDVAVEPCPVTRSPPRHCSASPSSRGCRRHRDPPELLQLLGDVQAPGAGDAPRGRAPPPTATSPSFCSSLRRRPGRPARG